ncbi:MAG TPA: Spy/CpxP family protein refolding chaperone [Planctomycetota bacterium]|nr:Spy/CpxP family protein refolding chaperone [Planctomycetota bacterium]
MQKVALLVSVVALAASGWLLWTSKSAGAEVDRLRRDLDVLTALEARVVALEGAPVAGPAAPRLASALGSPPAETTAAGGPTAATESAPATAARAATVPARVTDLEKRLAALEETTRQQPRPFAAAPMPRLTTPAGGRVYMSIEDAKEDLELTDQQKAEFERVVAEAQEQAEALRKIPDDEGKTWAQAQREIFSAEGGTFRFDMTKAEAFRNKMVPGRSETYGQADQRIRDEAKRRMRNGLSSAQQEKFDKASTEPLLGGGGSAAFVTTIGVAGEVEEAK